MQVKGQNNINVKWEENLIKQGILNLKILTLNWEQSDGWNKA